LARNRPDTERDIRGYERDARRAEANQYGATATAQVLQVINSSPGNLAPVFDAILEKTMAFCVASFGDLSTYAGEQFRAVATRGFPPALIDFYRDPFTPGPKSYFRQLVNGENLLHIVDMAAEFSSVPGTPLSRAGVERGRALVELGHARTGLFLALRKDHALLGAMRIFRQELRPFTDKQIALVENFAAQAVIAMENARLIGELRERTDQVAELNRGLEVRVAEQVEELGRVGRPPSFPSVGAEDAGIRAAVTMPPGTRVLSRYRRHTNTLASLRQSGCCRRSFRICSRIGCIGDCTLLRSTGARAPAPTNTPASYLDFMCFPFLSD
jgi:hypothetical protein